MVGNLIWGMECGSCSMAQKNKNVALGSESKAAICNRNFGKTLVGKMKLSTLELSKTTMSRASTEKLNKTNIPGFCWFRHLIQTVFNTILGILRIWKIFLDKFHEHNNVVQNLPTFLACNRIQFWPPTPSCGACLWVVVTTVPMPQAWLLCTFWVTQSLLFPTCTCHYDYAVSLNITEADEAYLKKLFQWKMECFVKTW